MAEAFQLGVDVIATDFGGNTDFCTGPLAHPVRWRETPIPRGSYPHGDGHICAGPDVDYSAQLCEQVAERRQLAANNADAADPSRDALLLAPYRRRFSFHLTGNILQ